MGKKKVRRMVLKSMKRHLRAVEEKPILKGTKLHTNRSSYLADQKKIMAESHVFADDFHRKEMKKAQKRLERYKAGKPIKQHKKHKDRKKK